MYDNSIQHTTLSPTKFYLLAETMESLANYNDLAEQARKGIVLMKSEIDRQIKDLSKADQDMAREIRRTHRRRAFEKNSNDPLEELGPSIGNTFIGVVLGCLEGMKTSLDNLNEILISLQPDPLILPKVEEREKNMYTPEALQQFSVIVELNERSIRKFINGVLTLNSLRNQIIGGASRVAGLMDQYYQRLLKRHTVEGVEIHHNPVTTDIAITVYENIDSHGETSSGRSPDEVSAYSMRKAVILAEAIKSKSAHQFFAEPDDFIHTVIGHFNCLWELSDSMQTNFSPITESVLNIIDAHGTWISEQSLSKEDFNRELSLLYDLNPNNITFEDKTGILTTEERYLLKFRNETLHNVAQMLVNQVCSEEKLVKYVLGRKAELHKYFTEENSFYVCKIGTGNQFLGEAPGQLEVIPGSKPSVNLNEIIGSGFNEIRDFFDQVEISGKWKDLFIATSPSRTADKSNLLLVGPQGCGKTEAMRAVGSDGNSVSIFAQGSDFMTCWAGESQKNPKRLFEQAVKIQKESKRHVYILIDEIDQVLHADFSSGGAHYNLTREFQILMDGVVSYGGLSVWGATNHLERIPMPMIRRFSKVLVVGELDIESRVKLLQHYCNFMPIDGFEEDTWKKFAERLEGATGDIIRKVVDPVWRKKMRAFTEEHETLAEKLQDWLNRNDKFDIRNFSQNERGEFHKMLGEHVAITPKDLDESIENSLHNLAILNEIQTAKETYEKSKTIVTDLRNLQGVVDG